MKVTVIVDNKTEHTNCDAEWGLSLLIETGGKILLFDAGTTGMFARNAQNIGLDLRNVDAAIISHGHYDHTGGFPEFAALNRTAKIYLHREGLQKSYASEDGVTIAHPVGMRWTDTFAKQIASRLVFTEGHQQIYPGVAVLTNIPTVDSTYQTAAFYHEQAAENALGYELHKDPMRHEQLLVVTEGEGIYVFSGCSHTGILNILEYVRTFYPRQKIKGFIAGMHLFACTDAELDDVFAKLKAYDIEKYLPLHCTGMNAIVKMKLAFGNQCLITTAGDIVEI